MKRYNYQAWLAHSFILGCLASTTTVQAEIVPDTTLPTNSRVIPAASMVWNIEDGTIQGNNLFHSFREFSIPTGGRATFQNPLQIQNIFSRITGSSVSTIDGPIEAQGSASLFLMNPNGIIFGKNASLNIGGSFVATTANAIQFGDRGFFSASIPNIPSPLLTINPSAFLFNQIKSGSIQNNSIAPAGLISIDISGMPANASLYGLTVPAGRSLLLVGGDILLDGGRLNALQGRVELAGLTSPGSIGLEVDSNKNFYLTGFTDAIAQGDIVFRNQSQINLNEIQEVTFLGFPFPLELKLGSEISIHARNLSISNSSISSSPFNQENGGNIFVTAKSAFLDKAQLVTSPAKNITIGTAISGNVTLNIQDALTIQNGSQISTETFAAGNAGLISLQAGNSINITDGSLISSGTSGTGKGGDIDIKTGALILTGNAKVEAKTLGPGDAGNIAVMATNFVSLDKSKLSSVSELGETLGSSGNITIQTGKLMLNNRGELLTSSASKVAGTRAGDVVLNIHSQLSLSNKSRISSETLGRSSSGNITVEAGAISIIDSALRAATAPESTGGNAGNIKVNVRDSLVISQLKPLSLQEFPVPVGISSSTNASGQGGQLEIFAGNSVVLSGFGNDSRTGLFAAATGAGFGGNLTLNTTELKVQNGSEISVSSSNPVTGKAGIINISARSIYLDNQGKITAKTISGNGGDIRLQVQDLFLMRHQSSISTSAGTGSNGGNGGNITINMPRVFLVTAPNENNDITANAFNGSGGKVEITAKGIYWFTPRSRADLVRLLGTNDPSKLDPRLLTSNDITAISQNNPNLNGTVAIAILGLDPSRGLLELPGNLVDPASLISQDCKPGNKQANSSFVDTGRGGLPANPMGMLGGEAVIRRLATLDPPAGSQSSGESSEDNSSESYSQGQRMPAIAQAAPGIVEAQGWIVRPDGVVVLVADPPTATPAAPMLATSSCQYR